MVYIDQIDFLKFKLCNKYYLSLNSLKYMCFENISYMYYFVDNKLLVDVSGIRIELE